MNTAGPLTDRSKKELADLARRRGIRGWESMSKDELVRSLGKAKPAQPAPKAAKPVKPAPRPVAKPNPRFSTKPLAKAAKPAAKSAAKVTKPVAKPAAKTRPMPVRSAPVRPTPAAKPGVNGTHAHARPVAKPALPVSRPVAAPPKPPIPVAKTAPKPPLPAAKAAPKPGLLAAKPAAALPTPRPPMPPIPVAKDLATGRGGPLTGGYTKDRILLMVPDPFWLHAYWELTHQSVQRAEAALKQDWHGAKPVIRLFDVTSQDTTSTSETPVRDIVIHGGCNNWYIDVPQPPRSYRADIGYVSRRGDFFVLARSNVVTPPKAGSTESVDVGWGEMDAKKAERILAMSSGFESSGNPELKELFEERLRRPMGAPKETGFGTGAVPPASIKKFFFDIDAELIVYGKTDPTAHVTLQNEPVKLRPDGTFTMLFSLTDSRQIIPAVATSADGVEERTIVLAVERNIKHLDPMIHDQMAEG